MNYSDLILTAGVIVLALSLVPAVFRRARMPLLTTGPSALALVAMGLVDFHLNLRIAGTATLWSALLWSWLFFVGAALKGNDRID